MLEETFERMNKEVDALTVMWFAFGEGWEASLACGIAIAAVV